MLNRFTLCLILATLCGCGEGLSVQPVTGKVTLDGSPLAAATVSFTPATEGSGMPAVGSTDAQGVYKLTDLRSEKAGSGADVGSYRVSIIWRKSSGPDLSQADGETPTEGAGGEQNLSGDSQIAESIPAACMNPATSGFTAEVVKGENEFNFELTKNFKGAGK